MKILLAHTSVLKKKATITLGGSKSESNRLLVLQALFDNLTITNLSSSDDSNALIEALSIDKGIVDIHHAGTAMRFLTAYFATQEGREVTLTGSARMQQRPIGTLVDALCELGATISYLNKEGFPPLQITGKKLTKNKVKIAANVSSQFISALLLIAPSLPNGLTVFLDGNVTSAPYLKMTLQLLEQLGFKSDFNGNVITVSPGVISEEKQVNVESDWSSVSYIFSLVALSQDSEITVNTFKQSSLQGDKALAVIYQELGVCTIFNENESITLRKISEATERYLKFNLIDTPDIAQTIAVTCFGLGISCELTGLHTLKIKETDRLLALKIELEKLGAQVAITEDALLLQKSKAIRANVSIDTYQDHRMAMAFAPLALKTSLVINDAGVVSKSFPEFWNVLSDLNILLKEE